MGLDRDGLEGEELRGPEGMTRSEILDSFSRHKAKQLAAAIDELLEANLITESVEEHDGPGRSARRYYIV